MRKGALLVCLLVTSGVSGGLTLALLAVMNPGDEVLFADPYFVSYLQLVNMFGGAPVTVQAPLASHPDDSRDKTVPSAGSPRFH